MNSIIESLPKLHEAIENRWRSLYDFKYSEEEILCAWYFLLGAEDASTDRYLKKELRFLQEIVASMMGDALL